MKLKFLTTALIFTSLVHADTYTTEGSGTAESKKEACVKALANAKGLAMEEAGTVVFSNYIATTSSAKDNFEKSSKHQLITAALGVAKLQNKTETVSVSENYQFTCNVNASFEIDQEEMKATLEKAIEEQKNQKDKSGYFEADGYSEEGQSRYKANTAAMLIAQRNLLGKIKGAKITSLTKMDGGLINEDKVGKLIRGTLMEAEVVKKEYDYNTRSSYVVLRIKKEKIIQAIKAAQ